MLLTTLCFACEGDSAVAEAAALEGRWELDRATRNNMETQMLEGLFYAFQPDGSLRTNLMGNELTGTYELSETTVVTQGVRPPLTYEVLTLSDSTLHLRTELQGFRFDFELVRPIAEIAQ